ncbi:MAG: metallophosphoesterase [Saprospiraceae bacterium]
MKGFLWTLSLIIMFFESNQLANGQSQVDGPYVFYKRDKILVKTILSQDDIKSVHIDSFPTSQKKNITLQVNTDEPGKTFSVKLKLRLEKENSETNKVSKQLILSDIEANIKAFRLLLQANGVIDADFNWTFGDGHLVLTGDFFDRGDQLQEVLWLIYSLEDKAKAAKGYVHFILGNHEIMNLNGDLRYVPKKYFDHAKLMGVTYLSLYWDDTEIGRWLRTKNIIEKVGDFLCMHGGFSPIMNQVALPLAKINSLARPYYADTAYAYPDPVTDLIYSDLGPFWYRGYYTGKNKITIEQIDSTLDLYHVKHIAIGHTIVADVVNVSYNGKIFNTDVPHAKGFSEALLVENNKYYRVNTNGERKEFTLR